MKKQILFLFAAALLSRPVLSLRAMDIGNGISLGGGVKTGIEIKNSDYTGNLEGSDPAGEYPMTLYFASRDNESHNGEGWFNFNYSRTGTRNDQSWGLGLGGWAHGTLEKYEDTFHLGDHYLWANFLDGQIRLIGGQGGGSPISTGGWLDAGWLSYNGIRLFYVSPFGLSLGINFADPGEEGIKPVEYLTTIMLGAKYEVQDFWVALLLDNNPIYDDSEANFDGGLHDRGPPISQAGNLGVGLGKNKLYAGKGLAALDMIVTSLGEEHLTSLLNSGYTYSPVEITAALKTGYPWLDGKFYTEVKAKYFVKQGDNADASGSAMWGLLTLEPYVYYEILSGLKAEISVTPNFYINSYYLAVDTTPDASGMKYFKGQNSAAPALGDFASTYTFSVNPKLSYALGGSVFVLGYEGIFSRDHVENIFYADFRWSF